MFIYTGTRFLALISLDELLLQSVLGKNIRRHQPFDYDESFNLSVSDPRSIIDQSVQNVLSHWMPRFIIDCYIDLVLGDNKKAYTITYKDPENILAPTLVNYSESRYKMKPKQRDRHGQTKIGEFKHMIEIERMGEVTRDYLQIPPPDHDKEYQDKFEHHFKLPLQSSPHVIQERIKRASKYPNQNLAKKYARKENHKDNLMYFLVDDASFVCYLDVVEGMTFLVNFKNEQDLRNFTETVSDLKHTWVSLRDLAEDDDSNNDDSLERKIPVFTTKDLHSFECNSLLIQHLQSVLNFVNFRSTDHDELLCHNTTTWFSNVKYLYSPQRTYILLNVIRY